MSNSNNNHMKLPFRPALLLFIFPVVAFIFTYQDIEAQLRYNLDNPVTHIKFITSNSTDDLSTQFNKFIVNKTFESRVFELVNIEVIEFDTLNNNYSVMITYLDLNEESPDRALADLEERLLRAQEFELQNE